MSLKTRVEKVIIDLKEIQEETRPTDVIDEIDEAINILQSISFRIYGYGED